MAFAPVTEMTEDFMKKAQSQMEAYRAAGLTAHGAADEEEEEEEYPPVSPASSPGGATNPGVSPSM